ncbi:FG-GAP-like repeat-containing protein [Posidoniimonas corsicana]|nr:FG-GAP-like repeat-containing protein [Posidoniimonas corsicana]
MGQFKYAEAVEKLRPLAKSSRSGGDVQVDLAIALLNRRAGDDLSQAATLLDGVLAETPDNLRARYCRALLLFHDGQSDAALDAFRRVAEADPSDPFAAYYVGQCLLGMKNYEQAVAWFRRAAQTDPYLRSAYYGEAQTLRRLGRADEAQSALSEFQRLSTNPRSRVADLKYSRMGPKAEVSGGVLGPVATQPLPSGPLFDSPRTIKVEGAVGEVGDGTSTTVVDLSGDGELDLFLADPAGRPRILLGDGEAFELNPDHPLAQVTGVGAVLWGDFNDDGMVDAYLCCRGKNQLWRQLGDGSWEDVTTSAAAGGGDHTTVDGACYDIDHDGDLDYILLQAGAPRVVLINNRDGTFRSAAEELGLAGGPEGSSGLVIADLDQDDDADLIFLNDGRPHEVLQNDRLWNYSPAPGFEEFSESDCVACVSADADVDGLVELYTTGPSGVRRWASAEDGGWRSTALADQAATDLIAYDFNADTQAELALVTAEGIAVIDPMDGSQLATLKRGGAVGRPCLVVAEQGPELLGWAADGTLWKWPAGSGRWPFARVQLSGKTDRALEMRSNASGIGVVGHARSGKLWSALPGPRPTSMPGQSLQPFALGAGGAEQIDFLRLLWPDGVSQTELDLAVGKLHRISETQRQAGSCPLLFVWDGKRYAFVADMLGAGGLGFNLGRGEYYPPRPQESLLLPAGLLKPREGRLELKLGEPMEEICYFDAVRLVAYDVPPGWSITLDERFAGLGPGPTGEPVFYRSRLAPEEAMNDRGEDIRVALAEADGLPAPLDRRDSRFVGLTNPHSVTLSFTRPIDELEDPTLVFDGWVDYAYSQSAFAAWQAGETFVEPTIEAQAASGEWVVIADRFGYPAGTSRHGSVRLDGAALPSGATRLRISSNMLVYWDRLLLVDRASCPEAKRRAMRLRSASVADVGFAARRVDENRLSVYDYDDRPPLGDTRHPAGYYTEFGVATPLIEATDDAVAIIGPGEELHINFEAPSKPPPSGWTRQWVLEADGWCKDADLFTENAGTVAPLPRRPNAVEDARREQLHRQFNTRFRSGY